ncbi:MAG: hypothetical protein V3V08_01500, partial [Nannocystaceae bacterium]
MASSSNSNSNIRMFDSRTVSRYVKRGELTKSQHREFVQELPDCADNILRKEEGGDNDSFEAREARQRQAAQAARQPQIPVADSPNFPNLPNLPPAPATHAAPYPYAQPAPGQNPYAQPAPGQNPYAQPAPGQNPYAQP